MVTSPALGFQTPRAAKLPPLLLEGVVSFVTPQQREDPKLLNNGHLSIPPKKPLQNRNSTLAPVPVWTMRAHERRPTSNPPFSIGDPSFLLTGELSKKTAIPHIIDHPPRQPSINLLVVPPPKRGLPAISLMKGTLMASMNCSTPVLDIPMSCVVHAFAPPAITGDFLIRTTTNEPVVQYPVF